MKTITLLISILILTLNTFAQLMTGPPEELFRKRVIEDEMRYGNPYTMFVRGNNFNLNYSLELIREKIIDGVPNSDNKFKNPYAKLYFAIYNSAKEPEPNKPHDNTTTMHSSWVKNNAIVYLIGLKDTVINNKDSFIDISNKPERDDFASRAKNGLSTLNPFVIGCYGFDDCAVVHLKAFELIQYLQAYDLLKAGGALPPYDLDKNKGDNSPRNKLRFFARNLYAESNNIINSNTGWKKNHGIICASALGMAAIVLNKTI